MFWLLTASMGLFTECQLHSTNVTQSRSSDKRAGTNSTHDGKWRTILLFSILLWHAILLVSVARWPRHIFKCLHWSRAWSTPSLREPDCQTYIFLYALPFRNNKMLGWDAINFFLSESMRRVCKCSSVCDSSFFFLQNDHKHLSNTNQLCMDINYTGRGTLSI